jgi:hypothetical protein
MTRRYLLRQAPELAHFNVLHAALRTFELQLRLEHPTLDEAGPHPPPTLRHAVFLRAQINLLRRDLRRYRRAVLDAIRPRGASQRSWPF